MFKGGRACIIVRGRKSVGGERRGIVLVCQNEETGGENALIELITFRHGTKSGLNF